MGKELSNSAKQYIDKEIVGKVTNKIGDYQQIQAMLAFLSIMSNENFPLLLRYVSNYKKIDALNTFAKDKRVAKPVTKLYNHLTRKRFLWMAEDFVNTRARLSTNYVYAVTEIFKKLQQKAINDKKIINADEVKKNSKLMTDLLLAADIQSAKQTFDQYCTEQQKKNPQACSNERFQAVWDYFVKHKVDLKRLCALGRNQPINIKRTIQECEKVCRFFEDNDQATSFLARVIGSRYLKRGGRYYFNPNTVGWVAAVTTGLFTAGILTWVLSVITPILVSISPFVLVPATAIISIAILTCLPMLVKNFATWCATKFNEFKQDKLEDKLESSCESYAKIIADYRAKSLKTNPDSPVRRALEKLEVKEKVEKTTPELSNLQPNFG